MGNGASKKARAEAEKNYAEASSALAVRDQELVKAQKGLETSKTQEIRLADEAEKLRKKVVEIDALSTALEQERQKQIEKLQAELRVKDGEVVAQRRVVESRTYERDDAKKTMVQMEEKVKLIEQKSQLSSEEYETRRKELEEAARSREKELEDVKAESESLSEKVRMLEDRHETLSEEFVTAVSTADEKLAVAKEAADKEISMAKTNAAEELSTARANAAEELATAKASMSESARNLTTVSSELASTKASLSSAITKLFTLQRTHNEAVSRRAASHEAFTATKMELTEAQQKYMTLYDAHEKQGRDLAEHLSTAKKDVGEAQQRHEMLQLAYDKLATEIARARQELVEERSARERTTTELAAMRKKLGGPEARKSASEVLVQEMRIGTNVEAAA